MISTGDGVTHINIYSQAETELGRLLSNWAHTPIDIPEHGYFQSIEGYWYWLKLPEGTPGRETLRGLYGFHAKKRGRDLSPDRIPFPAAMRVYIRQALRIKVETHPRLKQLMLENELPYKHYYVYAGRIIEPQTDLWFVDAVEHLARQLKAEAKHEPR